MRHIDLSVGSMLGFVSIVIGVAQVYWLPALSGPRQSGDLDHRRRHRACGRRADRRLPRLPGRLSRHPLLHRHARRPIVWRGAAWWVTAGADRRADGRALRADRRRPARFDRRDGELGARASSPASASSSASTPAAAARALPLSAAADLGGICHRRCRLPRRRSARRGRQRLSLARAGRRGLCQGDTTFPFRKAACSSRPATPSPC